MNKTNHSSVRKLVLSGLFTAIIFVLTAFFPIPLGHGYANAGDCFIVLSGLILGPLAGLSVSGIGSALADLYLGYSVYAPATLIIKGAMGLVSGLMYKRMTLKPGMKTILALLFVSVVCEIIMVSGYFVFETVFFGIGVALADVFGNSMQAAFGIFLSTAVSAVLSKTGVLQSIKG